MRAHTPDVFLTPKELRSKAQGWPRFWRPTLGVWAARTPTLKGLRTEHHAQPFQGWDGANMLTWSRPQTARPTPGFAPRPLWGRKTAGTLIVAAIGFTLLWGCGQQPKSQGSTDRPARSGVPGEILIPPDSPKLSRIKVESVREQNVALDEVVAPGVVEVNPNRMSQVLMPVAGRVRRVLVGLGDAVKEGQPVVAIISLEVGAAVAAYRQAEAGVGQARAAVAKAEADLTRISDLFAHRATAQKEVLAAENSLTQAKAEFEQKSASRDEALERLKIMGLQPADLTQEVIVRAPLSGKVVEIRVAPGEYRNDTSTPLLQIADLSTVWIAADVPESLIRLVTVGERIEVELPAYPGETFYARVTRIADFVDPATRAIKVRAEMANQGGRLRPEMWARIRHLETFRLVPVIPEGAVVQTEGRSIVYVERSPGVFREVEVKLGHRNGDVFPVLGGLKTGDRVVVDGTMLLRSP